ncbi:hypothetical protein Ciccas_003420 [Cichlidogyrus casuarinus]|uniref:Nicotinamide phosphoribosyltransferase n=1 Tax=Cichlidogyrus casuarinus TaxID=1844966 RepID=A0ABD2QEG0_9PLAT
MDALNNIMCLTDSYKTSHYRLYPTNCEYIYSYFESRGGKFEETVFFGLQYIIKKYLIGQVITEDKIKISKTVIDSHMGPDIFNEKGWRYILEKHGGKLPIVIKAVPEGTIVPVQNVLMTVENTDPACSWLTNYLETLLVQVWYPMTVATISFFQKKVLAAYLNKTSSSIKDILFKLHDFGFRGVSSVESAALGGIAHLVNFSATDTLASLLCAAKYYNCPCAGYSLPATEHSTITTWSEQGELNAYRNLLEKYPSGTIGCVSDSYNIFRACSELWGEALKEKVLERDGTLVIRPDSGDPCEILTKVLDILGSKFGFEKNEKGYKVLPQQVRIIQGDGISYDSLGKILESIAASGWSTENVTFGSGGALLQKMNRDTQQCAFKCSSVVVNGQESDVFKDPITDRNKKSKKGRLILEFNHVTNKLETYQQIKDVAPRKDVLREVFRDGLLLIDDTLDQIRKRIDSQVDFSNLHI